MQSGVSLSPWALSRRVPEVIKQIGECFALNTSNSQELVNKLKLVDYKLLQKLSNLFQLLQYLAYDPRYGLVYGPVIEPEHDNAFFTKKSHHLLVEGKFSKVPCIVGFNTLEVSVDFHSTQFIKK
ncbi:COesterase domain containing protein [Asbolus verrucosus]|uniref:COesterase domain containing protein n=1 Tax=Asbolus verrucosus TaxID=1661398 RepID=A0A482V796_ASBVE|nr:COesterase domain containing protein [Asbolus verrucosus]